MSKELPILKIQTGHRKWYDVLSCMWRWLRLAELMGVNGSWWELPEVNGSQRRLSAVNEGYRGLTIVILKRLVRVVESRGQEE